MQPKLKTVYAHHWLDGVKITASGRNELEALNNLRAKLRELKSNGAKS